MSYRPVCDVWLLARPKVKYHGSYPGGFPERARALLGVSIDDPVLHVCSGKVRDYPYRYAVGPNDRTLDLATLLEPDYLQDARDPYPECPPSLSIAGWGAVLADPPYTEDDADCYVPGREVLPSPGRILRNALQVVRPGGRVGILHYSVPRPPKDIRFVALVAVSTGYDQRVRAYSVFERTT